MNFSGVIDTALDRTIAPGYGNVGLLIRRHLPSWPQDPPQMDGRVVLVTGAATGIGLAATQGFADLGADVRALVRSEQRAGELRSLIARDFGAAGPRVKVVVADVSNVASVRQFAARFIANEPRLDVLVNNAGVMPPERKETSEGVELMFATHVVGPFLLTELLGDLLAENAPARVINVTSGGMYSQRLAIDDLQTRHTEYEPPKVYARTKRAQMIVTEQQAAELAPRGIVVHAMHPGWADTPGVQSSLPTFLKLTRPIIRTPGQGADTIVWLGGAPEPLQSTGKLWQDRHQRPTHYVSKTRESAGERRRLLAAVRELAGERVGSAEAA